MNDSATERRRAVVALGGNPLLRRGEVLLGELERAVVAEAQFLNEYAARKERRP
jgi:hypothetical protein